MIQNSQKNHQMIKKKWEM